MKCRPISSIELITRGLKIVESKLNQISAGYAFAAVTCWSKMNTFQYPREARFKKALDEFVALLAKLASDPVSAIAAHVHFLNRLLSEYS